MSDRPLFVRIRELAAKGRLDAMLPPRTDDLLPWPDWFGVMSFVLLVGAGIAISMFAVEERPPGVDADFDHPSFLAGLSMIALAGACWVMARVTVPRWQRQRKKLGRRGVIVPAAIVQANAAWYDPDNEAHLPGSVVVSFDPAAREAPDRVRAVASAVADLGESDRRELPAGHVVLAWAVYHGFAPHRSLAVPEELCGGLERCWLVSTRLPARPLRHEGTCVALALSGDASRDAVAVLPEDLARA